MLVIVTHLFSLASSVRNRPQRRQIRWWDLWVSAQWTALSLIQLLTL